jgi:hypothetical protein
MAEGVRKDEINKNNAFVWWLVCLPFKLYFVKLMGKKFSPAPLALLRKGSVVHYLLKFMMLH